MRHFLVVRGSNHSTREKCEALFSMQVVLNFQFDWNQRAACIFEHVLTGVAWFDNTRLQGASLETAQATCERVFQHLGFYIAPSFIFILRNPKP
jgi:hypothetical protein